jgi:RES domain
MADERKLCSECIGAGPLKEWREVNATDAECNFNPLHDGFQCVTVEEFAEEADRWFRDNYQPGAETMEADPDPDHDGVIYGTEGEPYEDIFAAELDAQEDVVQAIIEALPDASHRDIMDGAERFYTDATNFESIEVARAREKADQDDYWFENRHALEWEDFCEKVQFSGRFFGIKERLDELFGDPAEYGEGPIRPLYDLPVGQRVFRARLLNDELTEDTINEDPAKRLGAPPVKSTPSGRMNVDLIPAFYGAFSRATAIAELRPGIGDLIAVGQFATRKALRVFDFTIFDRRADDRTRFVSHSRYDFINQMQAEISKPIRPHERQREYIPTQIVAEYLRTYFACDAVIYRSSMQNLEGGENRNIVVLHRPAFVGTEDPNVLAYVSWSLKEVRDVQYTVIDSGIF